jgi:proteasome lid subunit RPN8/RPN11
VIQISADALAQIRRHARETYPEECCGALLGEPSGENARIQRVEALVNRSAEERGRRYVVSPEDYVRVERGAEKEGLSLLGFYHSHPDHPPVPSEFDREHALPFFHYIVMAVPRGEPGEALSWTLSADRGVFESEELVSDALRR